MSEIYFRVLAGLCCRKYFEFYGTVIRTYQILPCKSFEIL